jgi:hypothetical protein
MRVIASDGFNTGMAQSHSSFTIQPHPPSVTINAPMNGIIFSRDQQIFLDASANDMQNGVLDGSSVRWRLCKHKELRHRDVGQSNAVCRSNRN